MTIAEFIKRLQEMPQELLVVRRRGTQSQGFYYEPMDDWWPQFVELMPPTETLRAGVYYNASKWGTVEDDVTSYIEALEI